MNSRSVRLAAALLVPLVTLAAGLAIGYFAGRFVPSERWVFGQFADRVVLAERMRAGDRDGYELLAMPSIALMALQLHDAGLLQKDDPQVAEFARRALDLLRDTPGRLGGSELSTEAIEVLRAVVPEAS